MRTGSQGKSVDVQMPKRREGLVERELPDELILYDPETDRAFLLNHTSAAVWDLCNGQSPKEEIAEALVRHLGAPAETAGEHVRGTIDRFGRNGLLASE